MRDCAIRESDKLIPLKEAAEYLGYSVKGFRKIVERSRRRANGAAIEGRFIKFFQVGRGEIRFRREWLDEFVEANTVDPTVPLVPVAKTAKKAKLKPAKKDYSIFSQR